MKISALCSFFILANSILSAQTTLERMTIFEDDFSDNRHQWPIKNTDADVMSMQNGIFHWESSSQMGGQVFREIIGLDSDKEYIITTKYTRKNISTDHRFILLWGLNDGGNYWGFSVRKNDYYIFQKERGLTHSLCNYTKSSVIRDTNEVVVHHKAQKTDFYINGQLVFSTPKPVRIINNNVGFAHGSNGTVDVDFIKVEQYNEPIRLLPDADAFGTPERLSDSINSQYSDAVPIISHDAQYLYFVRFQSPQNVGGGKASDIYYSKLNADGTWGLATQLDTPINNIYNNAVTAATPDGNRLLIKGQYFKNGTFDRGLSIVERQGTGWGFPKNQLIQAYQNKSQYVDFTISPDGNALIMAVERDDSKGDRDLYISTLQKDNTWSVPQNMGDVLNTIKADFAPFLAADGKTLYFASAGHAGYGDVDVFVAHRLDSTWFNWEKPYNLGKKINTPSFDAYYTVPAMGDYAYYVSFQPKSREDVFRIKLAPKAKPEPTVLVQGTVYDARTKKPLGANIIYESLDKQKALGKAISNPSDGHYQIMLPYGDSYGFLAQAPQYLAVSENISIMEHQANDQNQILMRKDLYLVPMKVGENVRLNNLFFEVNKWDILPASSRELQRLVEWLKAYPNAEIQLEGHTDNNGSDAQNKTLSEKRVNSVKDYLIAQGLDSKRIKCLGLGESKPIGDNNTEAGRQENRRVEFRILKM